MRSRRRTIDGRYRREGGEDKGKGVRSLLDIIGSPLCWGPERVS